VLTLPDADIPAMLALGFGWEPVRDDARGRHQIYGRRMACMGLRDRLAAEQYPPVPGGAPAQEHRFLGWPRSHQGDVLALYAMAEAEQWDQTMTNDEFWSEDD
jgi:hypothetical protein